VALTVGYASFVGWKDREITLQSADKVVSNSDSVLLAAYARWGACLHDPHQQRQLIKGLKRLRFTP